MRAAYALSILFVLTPVLTAQSSPATVTLTETPRRNCPVAVSAQRWAPGGMAVAHDAHSATEGRELYLHFAPGSKSGVIAATVTLHGDDGSPRTELVAKGSHPSNLTETFHLTSGTKPSLHDSTVAPSRVVNVRWIGITEVRFADGSTWQESRDSSCHITPNGFRLVAAAK